MKTYTVKEIFYTIQGEGHQSGRAAVFLRFAGCNLWNGLESGRHTGKGGCALWCDTLFVGTDGENGGKYQTIELANKVFSIWWAGAPLSTRGRPLVVITGGEPTLQLDTKLIRCLQELGLEVAVESNGTIEAPAGIDWLCISPKAGSVLKQTTGNELKLVYPQSDNRPAEFEHLKFDHFFLQPKDGPDAAKSLEMTVQYVMSNPMWRISIQTHKLMGVR